MNAATQFGHPTSAMCNLKFGQYPSIVSEITDTAFFIIDNIKLVAKDHTMEFDYLNANNIITYIDPIVPFMTAFGIPNVSYFEVPKGSGKTTMFTSNIWLGGMDEQDNLHVAAHTFCQRGFDFWLGPQTNDFTLKDTLDKYNQPYKIKTYSDAFIQKYYYTWKVTNVQIYNHKKHYADAGYVMPWSIANWPAHGRPEFGESADLAPFIDVNKNGKYEPHLGDYPDINGDQAVFFIINDMGALQYYAEPPLYIGSGIGVGPHTESGGTPLKVEIMGMAFAFNNIDEALQNTIFLSYDIRNKSTHNYKDFYFGLFADFDLGYAWDDYVGCDSTLNLYYTYNGNDIDGNGESEAYGENPPVQGAMFLNQKMSAFAYHDNDLSVKGDPRTAADYYNYLRAIWKDGTPITMWGNGYNPASTDYTKFMFSGDPIAKTGWTELTPLGPDSVKNTPYDRRGMMSCGPFSLKKGESVTVDIAFPFARDESGKKGALNSLALLKNIMAPTLQEYYDEGLENYKGVKDHKAIESKVFVYPNPSTGSFTIACKQNIECIEIYDLLGKRVFVDTPKSQITQINTHLPQGFYIYRAVLQDKTVGSGKLIVK